MRFSESLLYLRDQRGTDVGKKKKNHGRRIPSDVFFFFIHNYCLFHYTLLTAHHLHSAGVVGLVCASALHNSAGLLHGVNPKEAYYRTTLPERAPPSIELYII